MPAFQGHIKPPDCQTPSSYRPSDSDYKDPFVKGRFIMDWADWSSV